MKYRLAVLALVVSFLMLAPAVIAAPTTDEDLYTKAVATMDALPESPYLTFVTDLDIDGGGPIYLSEAQGFLGQIQFYNGDMFSHGHSSWRINYRNNNEIASIGTKPGRHLVSYSPDFLPTWSGVYDLLRYGIDARPNPSALEPNSGASVTDAAQDMGINFYRLAQANETRCPGGSQALHLHFEALTDPLRHPLTDATIDLASMRFCSIRFKFGFNLYEERHFSDVNGYWITTSMTRSFGLQAGRGTTFWELHFTYYNVRFPDTLDQTLFVAQV